MYRLEFSKEELELLVTALNSSVYSHLTVRFLIDSINRQFSEQQNKNEDAKR